MSLILNIDTSTENASLCVAQDGTSIAAMSNPEQKDHAAWIHTAIKKLLQQANLSLHDLNAVAVTAGPGSYTGLRVGMSTAKGLCYALEVPMITENTLRVMALASRQEVKDSDKKNFLHCPMIDARRMEVFTALFNDALDEIIKSAALVLTDDLFHKQLDSQTLIFSGSGSRKLKALISHPNAVFSDINFSATQLAVLANDKFANGQFDDIAYAEPRYLKEFYTVSKK